MDLLLFERVINSLMLCRIIKIPDNRNSETLSSQESDGIPGFVLQTKRVLKRRRVVVFAEEFDFALFYVE